MLSHRYGHWNLTITECALLVKSLTGPWPNSIPFHSTMLMKYEICWCCCINDDNLDYWHQSEEIRRDRRDSITITIYLIHEFNKYRIHLINIYRIHLINISDQSHEIRRDPRDSDIGCFLAGDIRWSYKIQGVFFHWYPPKKLKYGKSRLGESTLT